MAKSISEAFRVLRSNLEITDLQEQTVSTRQQAIREVLERDFVVKETYRPDRASRPKPLVE